MSSDRPLPPQRDDDVEDAAVARAWASTQSAQPPPSLDDAVLKFARDAQAPVRARRRWQAPLALAAVLTLGLGVVLQLWREPQVRAPQAASTPAEMVAAAPMAEPSSVSSAAEEMRDAQAAEAVAEVRKREASAKRSESSNSRQREAAAAAEMQLNAERERRDAAARMEPPPPPPAPVFADAAPPVPVAAVDDAPRAFAPAVGAAAPRAFTPARAAAPARLPLAAEWAAGQGWSEAPQIEPHDWTCGQRPSGATSAAQTIWFYPTRGAWLVLDEEQRVLQVNRAAACE
ncbi:hypothetical protein [Hydrocarboniphaga sp.]|uniref:hypothetical protein n=1 Tax=Hydrocarboniphaga sp. TaxID=2033016 RepID=UPI003D142F40